MGHVLAMVAKTEDTGGTTAVPAAPPVSLSSGDVLRVRISETKEGGLFAPLALGGTVFDNLRVDHRGSISLPHAGRIKVVVFDSVVRRLSLCRQFCSHGPK